jgi:hypothetical protein
MKRIRTPGKGLWLERDQKRWRRLKEGTNDVITKMDMSL